MSLSRAAERLASKDGGCRDSCRDNGDRSEPAGRRADCVAEALVDTVGEERFDDLIAAAAEDGDPELRDQVVDVFASCDALDPVRDGG